MLEDNQSPKIYTVSALTGQIKDLLEEHFDFVWVEGEISNFRIPGSGHYYMVLKDEKSQIRAVMFRPQSRYLKFTPEDGMSVIAQGRVAVYQPRGEYQIILDYLEPLGIGALALAFEQLKKKLAAQGIFDEAERLLKSARAAFPQDTEPLLELGHLRYRQARYREASRYYLDAANLGVAYQGFLSAALSLAADSAMIEAEDYFMRARAAAPNEASRAQLDSLRARALR